MASTLTIPGRSYPIGTTSGQMALPSTQTYSHADITVDFTGWTLPTTTKVTVEVAFSADGGVTWNPLAAFSESTPPPYATKGGTTNVVTVSWDTPAVLNPTHLRGSVTVEGHAVTLGQMTVTAN